MVEVCLQCCAQPCDRAEQKTDVGLRGLQSTAERALCSSIHSKADRASVGCRHVGELPLVCFSCLPVCAHVWRTFTCLPALFRVHLSYLVWEGVVVVWEGGGCSVGGGGCSVGGGGCSVGGGWL